MKVKVTLHEFTYRDKGKYHTIVSQGDVPAENLEVKKALKKGYLVPLSEIKEDKKEKSK